MLQNAFKWVSDVKHLTNSYSKQPFESRKVNEYDEKHTRKWVSKMKNTQES